MSPSPAASRGIPGGCGPGRCGRWGTIVLAALASLGAAPAPPSGARPTARLADVAWIAGDWQGERGGTRYEERWTPPLGPVMNGQFRMVKDDRVVFYEFLAIEQDSTGPVLRMRHFGPGLIAWEDRESPKVFALVSHAPDEAVFDDAGTSDDVRRIIYRRLAPDSLLIRLVKVKDGVERHDEWRFARAPR